MADIPEYLSGFASGKKQNGSRVSFQLKCPCGCELFSVVRNSRTPEEKRLEREYEENLPDIGWHTIYGDRDADGKLYSYIKKFFFFKKRIDFPPSPAFMDVNVIKATCSQCKKEFTVFDSRYHGYDAQFAAEEQKAYVPHFENSKAKTGNITVTLEQNDEESVAPEYFSWIQISVMNGNKKHTFFDAETG